MTASIIPFAAYRATRRNRPAPCVASERAAYLELERRRLERIARAVQSAEDLAEALEGIAEGMK